MVIYQHPWQNDIVDLVKLGIFHLDKNTPFDNRIAFLLFDVSIESAFKTFLTLPEEITKAKIKYPQRKEAAEGNFHNLSRAIKEAASVITETEITHIQYYHDQRNKLYHQGTGITISQKNAFDYGQLAIEMIKKLLSVDLSGVLIAKTEMNAEAHIVHNRWQAILDGFQDVTFRVVENFEPRLLYPSSLRRLRSISNNETDRYSSPESNYRSLINECVDNERTKSWLLALIDSKKSVSLAARNLDTMMEWLKDPVYLCLLIIGFSLTLNDDFDTTILSPDEDIDIVERIDNHIFDIYRGVKSYLNLLNIDLLPLHGPDNFKEFINKGEKLCDHLMIKQNVLEDWLQKNT
ncbi:MAG TPA: hypothetical protein VKF38_14900 [Anaerolineaceae bacterium]|nr:hypothetical protein [Anaerolineaceae bacterium]